MLILLDGKYNFLTVIKSEKRPLEKNKMSVASKDIYALKYMLFKCFA